MCRARCRGVMIMNPLWLALHLPHLPLEANAPLPSPSAVVEHGRVLLGDAAARRAGVDEGIGVAAARALAPGVTLLARRRDQEEAALRSLACWAGSLAPRVSLAPQTLLLEIGSCLRLFGGVEKLCEVAAEGIAAQGFCARLAVAPTPLGVEWLARQHTDARCVDVARLRAELDALPVSVLPARAAMALGRFGARTLGEVRSLPSAALGQRIGVESLLLLARAYGEQPDPRADFVFPAQFSLPLQLPAAVENAAALLFAARRLTSALSGWLAARQAGVREAVLCLLHRCDETRVPLLFAEPTADSVRFERVLRERLDRLALAAPVEALSLEATQVSALAGRNRSLLDDGGGSPSGQEDIGVLFERLGARLGDGRVYRVAAHADHRPECATRRIGLFEKAPPGVSPGPPRPLWLLDSPEALPEVDGRPYRRGPLQLLTGPERIESGWWDAGEHAGDVRRDYFIALSQDAAWLWIYRECAAGGWFLHGYFS